MSGCDCRKNIEGKLLDRFIKQNPDASDHHVKLQGYGLVVTDTALVSRPCMQFKATADFPLKKGGTKRKTITNSMIFNYCPFCGKSLKEEGA